MNEIIRKIIGDRDLVRAFDDEKLALIQRVLERHLAADAVAARVPAQPAAPAASLAAAVGDPINEPLPVCEPGLYVAYVDGSCSGNPGPGGWAAWFPSLGHALVGGDNATTNNRMEIIAATKAIEAVPEGASIDIVTDSKLVVETMNGAWGRKSNIDLWTQLDAARKGRTVTFRWVRGHNGDAGNEKSNELAQAETLRRKEALARIGKAA